jgi:hypothetical protein
MKKAGDGLYDEVRATLALDQDATRDNLARLVDQVAAQIHPRDSFILFAAAHGYSLNGASTSSGWTRAASTPRHMSLAPSSRMSCRTGLPTASRPSALILLDTCESGALIAGYARSCTEAPASEAGVGRLHEGSATA